jgi:hypothetical protein
MNAYHKIKRIKKERVTQFKKEFTFFTRLLSYT